MYYKFCKIPRLEFSTLGLLPVSLEEHSRRRPILAQGPCRLVEDLFWNKNTALEDDLSLFMDTAS